GADPVARISVITVVRNGAECLEETMLSVLEQKTQRDLEYIVIDGASTDGSVDIIRRHAGRLHYWVSEPDAGIYHAMNKGWEAADDESFVLFMGAGDRVLSLPGDEELEQGDVVYGDVYMGERCLFRSRADFHLRLYNSLHHQALLVKRLLHPDAPFDTSFGTYADFDFNQRLLKAKVCFVRSPHFLAHARPGGVSDQQRFTESLRVIRKNFGVFWALAALTGYLAMKSLPIFKRLRPLHKGSFKDVR
ncbi:MAG: hypothetical protein ACD_55C00099G0001, partial [uncultured bacterium]